MADDFYTNFGKKHAIIEITQQTSLQRKYFSEHNEGKGTNISAHSLFDQPFTTEEIKKQTINKFKVDNIDRNLNPDFREITSIKYQALSHNIFFKNSDLSDKPDQFGPNIKTLKFDDLGQPDTSADRTENAYKTYKKGKGFGFTVDSNTLGSHIDANSDTTFGNYLSRKYDNDGRLLIKKGESIDHKDLDYES